MFSHITIGTHNLERATDFYDATLAPLGIERVAKKFPDWSAWKRHGEAQTFWVGRPYNRLPASWGNGTMVAFSAGSREEVDAAYAAAIKAGGIDDGPPGLRPGFGPNYYGAYVRDQDGNKIHFVHGGES